MLYLDSSAWVKRYIQEPGSGRLHILFDQKHRLASSLLGHLEVVAALSRRLSHTALARAESRLQTDWRDMALLPITDEIVERAVHLVRQYRLRGADALHLATALDSTTRLQSIKEPVVLVASDNELLAAAQAAGLAVENPATSVPIQP